MGITESSLADPGSPDGTPITHRLLVAGPQLQLAVQFELRPVQTSRRSGGGNAAGFACMAAGAGAAEAGGGFELPIVISATGIPVGQGWELRTSGLWAEQICEQPFRHWSYGLEAFALAIDTPDELLRRGHGYRRPLGWELDFIASSAPRQGGDGGVTQAGTVEGIVLSDEGETPIEGPALRGFWTGSPPTHSDLASLTHRSKRATEPLRLDQPKVVLPTMVGPWVIS